LVKEAKTKEQFEASLLLLKELEDKERQEKELIEKNPNVTPPTPIPTKKKPSPRLGHNHFNYV